MDASKKQREPVAFKSLAELKRFIRPGVEFKTVSHANHADMVGLTRVVTTVQTVGFYSKIKDQPEHPFSTCNHGKGFYTDFGKAGNYIFDGTTVKVKDTRKQDRGVIYELEFYDREQNMEETMMDRKMVNFIKEQYPPGTRIRLNSMDDPYAPILPGTEGEVDFVDDIGTIHMKWDNGRTLGIAPGEDSFIRARKKSWSVSWKKPAKRDACWKPSWMSLRRTLFTCPRCGPAGAIFISLTRRRAGAIRRCRRFSRCFRLWRGIWSRHGNMCACWGKLQGAGSHKTFVNRTIIGSMRSWSCLTQATGCSCESCSF